MKYNIVYSINKFLVKIGKLFLMIVMSLMALQLSAQQYPVQLTTQLNTPIPLNLSLFNAGVNPKINLTLTNRDLQGAPLKVKLKMIISGPGIQLITNANANLSAITLESGIPTVLTTADLEPYFNLNNIDFNGVLNKAQYQSSGQLPEGTYSYCFEVWDYGTNKLLSFPFCSYAYCTLSEPPLLNEPLNKSTILFDDPANIRFSWTPRHNDNPDLANVGASYRFTLKELIDTNVSAEVAFNTGRIIYTDLVSVTNLMYGVSLPSFVNLSSNKKYAWNVQVVSNDINYQPSIRNTGKSEIFSFDYKKDCTPPQFKSAEAIGRLADINWEQNRLVKDYDLMYAERNSNSWQHISITNGKTNAILDNISFGKVYKYNVGTVCDNSIEYGEQSYFSIAPPLSVTKSGTINWGMNGVTVSTIGANLIGESYNTSLRIATSNPTSVSQNAQNPTPLENVKVAVYKNSEPISITYTDVMGGYEIPIDTATILNDRNNVYSFKVVATGDTSMYKIASLEFSLSGKSTGTAILNEIQSNITLFVKSIIYKPQVHPANRQNIVAGAAGARVNVYLPLSVWLESYGKLNPSISPKIITYDNNEYVKIGIVNDQNRYLILPLSSNLHNVMTNIVIDNQDELIKNIKPILGSYWSNSVLASNYVTLSNEGKVFNTHLLFDPTVTFYGKIWRDPNKTEGLPNGQIEFKNISATSLAIANADNKGDYSLTIISSLIDPFTYLYASRMDNRIRRSTNSVNFEYPDTMINNNYINYDMVLPPLSGKVRFVYGRILDPNGFQFNSSGKILYNNEQIGVISRGFYTVKMEDGYKIEDSLTFNVPDFQKIPVFDSIVNLPTTDWFATFKQRLGVGGNTPPLSYNSETEELMGVTQADVTLPYGRQIILAPIFNNNPVNVKLKVINTSTNVEVVLRNNNIKKLFVFKGNLGAYKFEVLADSTSPNFLPFSGNFTVDGESQKIILKLNPATTITGRITEKNSIKKLDSAFVEFMGTEYKVMTDTNGVYSIKVPSREQRVHLKRARYAGMDTVLKLDYSTQFLTLNFSLPRHVNQLIRKISGYDVVVDKQNSPNYDSSYIVTGTLKLKSNDYYSLDSVNQILHFTDAKVIVNELGLAFPIDDSLRFNELIIRAKAFGFAPVEIVNPTLKQFANLSTTKRRFSEGIIVGKVIFKLNTIKASFPKFPFDFSDAGINYTPNTIDNNLTTFVSSGIDSSRVFPINKKFYIHLVNNVNVVSNYLERDLLKDYKIFIQKDSCILNPEGLSLAGHIKLPGFIFDPIAGGSERTKVHLKNTVLLDKQFQFQDWTSESMNNAESVVKLKRLYAKLSQIKFEDIGTDNASVSFNGQMAFFKEDFNVALRPWDIKTFAIKNPGTGLVGNLSITPSVKNFYFNGLTFAQKVKSDVVFNFLKADSSFSFSIQGIVSFAATGLGPKGEALSKILPMEIETFQYGSKNGSMLLSAKPNTTFDYGLVKISLKKFAINVGSQIGINDMLSLVQDTIAADRNYNSVLNETPSSKWAIALKGEVQLDKVRGFKVNSDATVAFGVFNDQFQFAVGEVGLGFKNSTFSFDGRLALKLYGDTIGFKGDVRMEALEKTTTTSLFYYKIKNEVAYFGGGGMFPLTPMVVTHPIQWYSVGFEYALANDNSTIYFGLLGQFGPVGTTKREGYVDSAYLGILFSTANGCGMKPVIRGGGNLILKDKKWGYASAELDFCNFSTLFNVHLDVPDILPNVKAKVDGILYAVAPLIGDLSHGMFFFDVNAKFSMGGIVEANALLAIGINYNNDKSYIPAIVKSAFADISDMVKSDIGSSRKAGFNGFLLDGNFSLAEQSGSYSLGPFNASYRIYANANRKFWYNYNDNNLGMSIALDGAATGSISAEHVASLSGNAEIHARLQGGYNGKWYFNGNFNTELQIYNNADIGCNRIDLDWGEECWKVSYPCGAYWFGINWCDKNVCVPYLRGVAFKGCLSLHVTTSWVEGESVQFNISK